MPEEDERTALYRFYDAEDRLLYVGISNQPAARWVQHQADKPWAQGVARREHEWFDSRVEAAAAEREAIRNEHPVHNHHKQSAIFPLLPPTPDQALRAQRKQIAADERSPYRRVAADVRALIMAGEISIGDRLPSTADFVQRYAITNATVQSALRSLKDEGFAVGRAGAGVYVTSPTASDVAIEDREVQAVKTRKGKPPAEVAEALGLGRAETVFERYLVLADGWPLEEVSSYRLDGEERETVGHTDRITARMPTSDERVHLQVPDDVPVMRIFRLLHDSTGSPMEAQVIIRPAHLHQLIYRISASE